MAQLGTQGGINIINSGDREIDEAALALPNTLAAALDWLPASNGTIHNTLVWTKYPVGSLRKMNQHRTTTQGEALSRSIELAILDATQDYDAAFLKGIIKDEAALSKLTLGAIKKTLATINPVFMQSILDQAETAGGAGANFNGVSTAFAGNYKVWFLALGDGMITGRVGKQANDADYLQIDVSSPYTLIEDGKRHSRQDLSILGWLQPVVEKRFAIATAKNIAATDKALVKAYRSIPQAARVFINALVVSGDFRTELTNSRTATTPTGSPAPVPRIWENGDLPITFIDLDEVDTVTTTTTSSTTTNG